MSKWNRIYIVAEMIKYKNNKSALIIANVNDEEYTFWYPLKLIQFYGKECADLIVSNDYVFTLKQSEKIGDEWVVFAELEVKGAEIEQYLKEFNLIHTPKKLEPIQNNEAIKELLDEVNNG